MRHRTRLTQPVRLINLDPQPLMHRINKLLRQRRSSTRNHLHTAQIVRIHHLVPSQSYNHRRRNIYKCDPVRLDAAQEQLHVKRRHDDELDPPVQHLVHEACEPVDMEERQHAEEFVGRGGVPVPD